MIGDNTIFFASDKENNYILNYPSGTWFEIKSSPPTNLLRGSCGLIRKENGKREIVYTVDQKTWIFSLDGEARWKPGPPFPGYDG